MPFQTKYQQAVDIQRHRIAYHEAIANSWRQLNMRDQSTQNSIIKGKEKGIHVFEHNALLTRRGKSVNFLSQGSSDQVNHDWKNGHYEEYYEGGNQPVMYPSEVQLDLNHEAGLSGAPNGSQHAGFPQVGQQAVWVQQVGPQQWVSIPPGYQSIYCQQPGFYTATQPPIGYQETAPPQQQIPQDNFQQYPQHVVNPMVVCHQTQQSINEVHPAIPEKIENAVESNNSANLHIQLPFRIPDTNSQTYGTYESGYRDTPLATLLPSENAIQNTNVQSGSKSFVGSSSLTIAKNIQSSPNTPNASSEINQQDYNCPKEIEECEEKQSVPLPTTIEANEEKEEEVPDVIQETVVKQEITVIELVEFPLLRSEPICQSARQKLEQAINPLLEKPDGRQQHRTQKVTPEATQKTINVTTTVQPLPSLTSEQSPRSSYANAVKSAPKSSPPKDVQKKSAAVLPVPKKKQPRTSDKQERKEHKTIVVKKASVVYSDILPIVTNRNGKDSCATKTKSPPKKREETPFASKTTFSPSHVPQPILLKEKEEKSEKKLSSPFTPIPPLSPTPLETTASFPTEILVMEQEKQKTENDGEEITSSSSSSQQPTPSQSKKDGKGKKKTGKQQKKIKKRNGVEFTEEDDKMLEKIIMDKEENEKKKTPPSPIPDNENDVFETRRKQILDSTQKEGFYSFVPNEDEVEVEAAHEGSSSLPRSQKVNVEDTEDMDELMNRLDGVSTDSDTDSVFEYVMEEPSDVKEEEEKVENCVSSVFSRINALEKIRKDGPLLEYMTNNIRQVIKDLSSRPPVGKEKPVKKQDARIQKQAVKAFFKDRREATKPSRNNYSRFLTEAYNCLLLNYNSNLVPIFFDLTKCKKEELSAKEKMVFIDVFHEEGGVKDFLNAV
ncbi:hypothetical protein GCK72_025182 [Caenorhabditis remanei]|uniref:Uncharacterized protein n=1 Tax=Caenorhabditis remanei TaxID=31234 RepID=A0A6A5G222_CAERE|nr:hypothetical protein GCK72_025182 [Caenorhabditis remanei]KAF1748715.1 hypothetical protein GCK72_025182 [Caenorhabditis remanei]